MTESLYKTKTPDVQAPGHQHYELSLGEETVDDRVGYFVREFHCWLAPAGRGLVRVQYTLSPRGGFATIEEARSRYDSQKLVRARHSYVHSYAPRYEPTIKFRYSKIEVPVAAKPEDEARNKAVDRMATSEAVEPQI